MLSRPSLQRLVRQGRCKGISAHGRRLLRLHHSSSSSSSSRCTSSYPLRPQLTTLARSSRPTPRGDQQCSTGNRALESSLHRPPGVPTVEEDSSTCVDEEALTLSDLDTISPNALITSFLVYKLQPEHSLELVEEALRRGLQSAAEQIPPLGAKICFDANGKPRKRLSRGSVHLRVRHFESWEHKSYDELASARFQPRDFEPGRLVPVDAYNKSGRRPVLVAQLSFIPGGAILALGFSHIASDGVSRGLALTALCKAGRDYYSTGGGAVPAAAAGAAAAAAAAAAAPPPPSQTVAFDFRRDALNAPEELRQAPREQLAARAKDYRIVDPATLIAAHAAAGTAAKSHIKSAVWTCRGASVQRLKQSCTPMQGVDYLSTYDCVAAALWRGVMRARVRLQPALQDAGSRMLHAVDLRGRDAQGPSRQYFGNAVRAVGAGPLPMTALLGADGLSRAASHLRRSILAVSLADVAGPTALGAFAAGPSEQLVFLPERGLEGSDFMLSGWSFMDVGAYDFGVGPPAAVRPPDAAVPGFAFLFPDCERRGGSRTYDIYLSLPAAEQELLDQDEEFRSWFRCS